MKTINDKALNTVEQKGFATIDDIKAELKSLTGLEINLHVWDDDRTESEKWECPAIRLDGEFVIDEEDEDYEEFSLWYVLRYGKMFITESTSNYFTVCN